MIRAIIFMACVALAGCAPPAATEAASALPTCGENDVPSGKLVEGACQLQASGETLRVKFAPIAAGTSWGTVTVEVLGEGGQVLQTLSEPEVSEYLSPSVEDVDGDGHADVLIARESGNVNIEWGVWVFNRERSHYERVGDASGVEIQRTSEGYIAVPARSSAAAWSIAFYRLDEGGLIPLATVYVEATGVTDDGRVTGQTCRIEDAPGLRDLRLTREAAQAKFCAEPAAGVFSQ